MVYYSYTRASGKALAALAKEGIPWFSTPGRTARAVGAALDYARFVDHLDQVAVFGSPAEHLGPWPAPARRLSESGARAYLAPLGIPSPDDRLARTADAAVEAFEELGGEPVALKVQSPDLAHKTDVGGVRLDVRTAAAVRTAFVEIVDGTRAAVAGARFDGVLVQRMAPAGVEVFLGARREPLVGALVLVGLGGMYVEVLADVALRLAPVSLAEAHAMLAELRGRALLNGARGRPRADMEALAATLVRMSELAAALPPGVASIEINPLLVLPAGQGVLMLDAAIEMEAG